MTTLDLDAIQARADAATEGPWTTMHPRPDGRNAVERRGYGIFGEEVSEFLLFDTNPADATFIAHARTDIPALIAEVKALRGRVAEVEELAQQIAENAEVNWEEDNFGAGQQQAANQIIDFLQSDTPTTGEPE